MKNAVATRIEIDVDLLKGEDIILLEGPREFRAVP
jgi:hypothetical protein